MDIGLDAGLGARSRLSGVRDVCEHEKDALEALEDVRLDGVPRALAAPRTEIAAALAPLKRDSGNLTRMLP